MLQRIFLWADLSCRFIVTLSFLLCGIIFVILRNRFHLDRRTSSEFTSIFHHIIVVVLAAWSLYENKEHVMNNSVLSESSAFLGANTIQWINIGYFLYDSVHALAWEHNFIIHHSVALSGFLASHYSGLGGLGNVMNTLIAEVGSIMYNVYNKHKSPRNYLLFVSIYATTRMIFVVWTYSVFAQLRFGYGNEAFSHCQYFVVFVFIFQSLLVCVNIQFLWVHLRKASKIIRQVSYSQQKQI